MKQYQRLFSLEDVELRFTDDALAAVARQAIDRETGARGLRSILEGMLLDTMYELPSATDIESVVVTEETVMSDAGPTVVRRGDAEASA